jgi:hypothetical protein
MPDIDYDLVTVDKVTDNDGKPLFIIKNPDNQVLCVIWFDNGFQMWRNSEIVTGMTTHSNLPEEIVKLFKTRFKFYSL